MVSVESLGSEASFLFPLDMSYDYNSATNHMLPFISLLWQQQKWHIYKILHPKKNKINHIKRNLFFLKKKLCHFLK